MPALLEYKCPNCAGAIAFDSATQQMECPFCGASFTMEALKAMDDGLNGAQRELSWDVPEGEWGQGETEGMAVYSCQSCGGEIVADPTTAATKCPYCDNPVVMKGQFAGALRPDAVIPFKLDKKAAREALQKHLQKKRLLPKVFKDQNHIDEVKGVYVPFWLYDANMDANLRYKATKVRTWTSGSYNYTETSTYYAYRGGRVAFDKVPVDGSSKMADDLMESIEPFDWRDAVDFQTAYLAGYLADKYDVDAQASQARANERIRKSTEDAFAKTVTGFNSVAPEGGYVNLLGGTVRYALYPVWLLNTTWRGKKFTFAMNGQTGKFVGDLPVDKGAARLWRWGLTLGIGGLVSALGALIWAIQGVLV
jgi:DNA-directed RNA polymerase subunit RPC12/RpoP